MCNPAVKMGFFDWTTDCISHPPSHSEVIMTILIIGIVIGGLKMLYELHQQKEGEQK